MKKFIKTQFNASINNVTLARSIATCFLLDENLTVATLNEIKTIVSEGISNAIIHGYKLNGSRDVFVKVYIKKRKVEIIIQDYGIGIKNLNEAT